MWAIIIGMGLIAPIQISVEKLEALNQRADMVELQRYEEKLAKEYGIKEIKRLKMGEVFSYPKQKKQSLRGE